MTHLPSNANVPHTTAGTPPARIRAAISARAEIYARRVRAAVRELEIASQFCTPANEHATMTCLVELKNLYAATLEPMPMNELDDGPFMLDFGDELEAGIPGHGPLKEVR